MKLKTLLLTTALVASSAFADAPAPSVKKHTAAAQASEGYYLKIEAGAAKPKTMKIATGKTKFKTGFVGGLGGGYQFNEFLRSDLMLQYRVLKAKGSNRKLKGSNVMLNGYLDGHNDTIFTPYLTAGVGAARFKQSGTKAKTNFLWNAGLGTRAKVYDQISVDLGYRYIDFGKIAKKSKAKLKNHEVVAGLIWQL